ncbi:hypothetical protein PP749_gp013 [Rhizobium phage RHEph22]|uniref:Transmembrane protein n=1 Tax=Rhizobium phage RHEph22 TaxID=2836135 RepID=A0AAE7VMT5_9CAUD|nr:hypothetical protein PP749_gp013 [Rhizobium phage RHEph22]QXV74686.1 hypothetical protein [Rhizobium phage RHEph22]
MKYAVSIITLLHLYLMVAIIRDNQGSPEAIITLVIFTFIIPILLCYLIRHITMWFSIMYIRRNM